MKEPLKTKKIELSEILSKLSKILSKMTKEEIIELWLDKHPFDNIKMSDVLYNRWHIASEKASKLSKELLNFNSWCDFEKRDELYKQYNDTKNIDEALEILKKIEPYNKQFEKRRKLIDEVDAAYKSGVPLNILFLTNSIDFLS